MIWIEILSRQRDVLARHRMADGAITIGRGYANDIVLDDPHVAPDHLRIERDADGQLVAIDLGSLNGLYLDDHRDRVDRLVLDGDAPIRVGQTLLRVREASYAVAAERPAVAVRRSWPLLSLLIVLILGIELIGAWRGDFREFKLGTYMQPLLVVIVTVGVWVSVWTLVCRLVTRVGRFKTHFLIGLVTLLTISVVNELVDFAAFALSLPALLDARSGLSLVLIGIAAFCHMRVIGPARLRIKLAGAAAVPVLIIGYHLITEADDQRSYDPPHVVRLLMPPAFRLSPFKSEDRFLADLVAMKPELERNRTDKAQ
jgi:hypothetical protein